MVAHLWEPSALFAMLAISLIALVAGPLLLGLARRRLTLEQGLGALTLVAITGLLLGHVVPDSVATAGWPAGVAAALGLAIPIVFDHALHASEHRRTRQLFHLFALAGLAVHALLDGAAIAMGHGEAEHEARMLAIAVLLHRLPVGLAIWWIVRPLRGPLAAAGVLAIEGGATIVGALAAGSLLANASASSLAILQAFMAGVLLHVIVHHRPPLDATSSPLRARIALAVGAACGAALVVALSLVAHDAAHG